MATAVTRACTPRKSQVTTIRLQGSEASELGGTILRRCPLGHSARLGVRRVEREKVRTFEARRATPEEKRRRGENVRTLRALGDGRVPGKRLRSNRWVGRVKKRGWAGG